MRFKGVNLLRNRTNAVEAHKDLINKLEENSMDGKILHREAKTISYEGIELLCKRINALENNKNQINNQESTLTDNYKDYIEGIQFIDRKQLLRGKEEPQDWEPSQENLIKVLWDGVNSGILRWAKRHFPISEKDPHQKIAFRVYNRLRFRNAQLRELEEQARGYLVHNDLKSASAKKEYGGPIASARNSDEADFAKRAYNIAVTDLFVEKAMTYLEDRAEEYKKKGHRMIRSGQIVYIIGTLIACSIVGRFEYSSKFQEIPLVGPALFSVLKFIPDFKIMEPINTNNISERTTTIEANGKRITIEKFENNSANHLSSFAKSFSALGMIVLVGVSLTRYGKVMLDQAERLLERRHALRQGRLFVHLNEGKIDIDEMDKAFNWNVAGANSFSHLPTEAQAPWGSVIKEVGHKVPELIQSAIEALSGKRK
jgi:hypothetical protein